MEKYTTNEWNRLLSVCNSTSLTAVELWLGFEKLASFIKKLSEPSSMKKNKISDEGGRGIRYILTTSACKKHLPD